MIKWVNQIFQLKFVRFLLIGGVNTLFGYGVFAFLIFIGLSYQWAIVLGTIICILFNFKTIGKFVFDNNGFNAFLLFKFISVYAIGMLLNLAGMRILLKFIGSEYIAGLVLIIPVAAVTFMLNKWYVFAHGSPERKEQ